MSVDRFMAENKPNQGLRQAVLERQRRVGDVGPPLLYFTGELVKAATERIREADRMIGRGGSSASVPDRDSGHELFEACAQDYAAIIFGSTILGLWDMLATGEFDHQAFTDRVNIAFSGTRLATLSVTGDKLETIPPRQLQAMSESAAKQGSFAEFFLEPSGLLPARLHGRFKEMQSYLDFLEKTGFLAKWHQRAKLLATDSADALHAAPADIKPSGTGENKGLELSPAVGRAIEEILERLNF